MGGKFLQAKKLTISSTVKKKFFLALFIGFFLLGFLMLSFGITGTAFALPLGGMGDFYVKFSKLEGKGFVMHPQIGETGQASDVPLVRNKIDQASIDDLHIYKDLKLPANNWIRINIIASEPTNIEGLIQDAQFIDANLQFDEMEMKQTNTSEISTEEALQKNWGQDADTVTITDAEIVTDYLFQNMVTLNGAVISIEAIDEPNETVVDDKDRDENDVASADSSGSKGLKLPETASHIFAFLLLGSVLVVVGISFFLFKNRKNRAIKENKKI